MERGRERERLDTINESQLITQKVLACFAAVSLGASVYLGGKRMAKKRQGQSDLRSYYVDERSYHFGCFDNGDFSLLGSISFSLRLYQGNYPA